MDIIVSLLFTLLSIVYAEDCSPPYAQCGGNGWTGPVCCTPGYTCTEFSQWYSNCRPTNSTLPPSPQPSPVGPTPVPSPVAPTSVPTVVPTNAPTVAPTASPTAAPTAVPTPTPTQSCAGQWAQCGGQGWTGPTCCLNNCKCVEQSQWYSQCTC